ncbi:MAG: HEAT repeat domain-containing protein [Proteobacteria bacterium]|nr:HEAT repeat domain-containing protein [Pseudomonadota bacterium]
MVELKEYEQGDLSPEEQLTVLEHLNDPDERVRATLIYIIGKWNIPNAQSILSISLRDSDSRVRANALESIRAHHLEKSLFLEIQPLLQDKNNRVRANAAMLIAQQDPPAAISTVQHMLGSSDPLTRSSGAWLVGAIQPEKGGQILLDGLKNERDDIVINQMVRSLAKLAKVQMPLHQQVQQLFGLGETS